MTRIFIWSDSDLDGAGCILALKWLYEQHGIIVEYDSVWNGQDLSFKFKEWLDNNMHRYDKVFICDLSLEEDVIGVVDRDKVVVIDHHKTHLDNKDKYKNAKVIIYEHTSTTDIIRSKFKLDDKIDEEQKQLLIRIDDYDQYKLEFPESIRLNAILKKFKTKKFVEAFDAGLREFTLQEKSIIKLFSSELRNQIDGTQYFEGKIKDYKVIACYVEKYSSETCNIVLKRFDADICFAINLKYCSVSIRKNRRCPLKLNVFAETFCDGGGHEFAAAGKLTDKFATLLKDFKEVK